MAASSVAGPDSLPVSSSALWPKLLKAGASSISFDHLERSDLQLLLSARGQAIDGTNECLLKRLQVFSRSTDSHWRKGCALAPPDNACFRLYHPVFPALPATAIVTWQDISHQHAHLALRDVPMTCRLYM